MSAFLYLTTVLICGTTFFAITLQINEVPVLQSVFYRFFVAALLMWTVSLLRGAKVDAEFALGVALAFASTLCASMGNFLILPKRDKAEPNQ